MSLTAIGAMQGRPTSIAGAILALLVSPEVNVQLILSRGLKPGGGALISGELARDHRMVGLEGRQLGIFGI